MPCTRIKDGFLCGPAIHKFDGWTFEVHSYCGPWPLRKDGEPRKRAGRKFYEMYEKWEKRRAASCSMK